VNVMGASYNGRYGVTSHNRKIYLHIERHMHFVSVVAMFKNESQVIKEWIEHYLSEGVCHFYLIDNGSDDDYFSKISPYIEIGLITLVKDSYRQPIGTQDVLYNKHYLSKIKHESEWIIVVDVDEYIYGRNGHDTISTYLASISADIDKIVLPWKMFGSNGIINQPEHIVSSFTKRETDKMFHERVLDRPNQNHAGHSKSIIRVARLIYLSTHSSSIDSKNVRFSDYSHIDFKQYDSEKQNMHINHYSHMSLEYYTKTKIKRGGGQSGMIYTMDKFNACEKIYNSEIDNELLDKKYGAIR
jgi:hypothetical protein